MYFRKMRPRTTCLYSAASMLLRILSAAAHSVASKPRFAPFPFPLVFRLPLGMLFCSSYSIFRSCLRFIWRSPGHKGYMMRKNCSQINNANRMIEGILSNVHAALYMNIWIIYDQAFSNRCFIQFDISRNQC
jgi:hypothetical protein